MEGSGFSSRSMAAISLILIASLVVLATLINTGLHRLRVESALSAKNNAVYYLIHQALTTNQHNGVIGAGEFDVKQLIKACARSKLETPRRNENFKLMERLSCDLKSNLQLELEVMLVKTTGYNPGIQLLMGFTNQTKLIFVRVLEHYETANFGTRLLAPGNVWLDSQLSRSQDSFMAPMAADQLDAVSGATITAGAIRSAIREAYKLLNNERLSANQTSSYITNDDQVGND